MKHIKGLDSLRFLAATLVLVTHSYGFYKRNIFNELAHLPIFDKGHTAVSFFFTLSGFLITLLLINEIKNTDRIILKNFYLKRVFRIWPLYFLITVIGLFFYNWFLPNFKNDTSQIIEIKKFSIYYATFFSNYFNSFFAVGGILMVTWSISIEEQFYLFWAPLIRFFKNNIFIPIFLIFTIFVSISFFNYYFVEDSNLHYFLYSLQFHNMAIGALFSYLFFNKSKVDWLFVFINKYQVVNIASIVTIIFLLFMNIDHFNPFFNILNSILYGIIILGFTDAQPKTLILKTRITEKLGLISFGVYMYHYIAIYIVGYIYSYISLPTNNYTAFMIFIITSLLITLAIAQISFIFFEKPIINKGRNVFIKA